jgi:hypothetical protein
LATGFLQSNYYSCLPVGEAMTLTELKQLAERATPKWKSGVWCGDDDNKWAAIGPQHKQTSDEWELDPESTAGKAAERDAAYIAAVSPDVILRLIAVAEAANALWGNYSKENLAQTKDNVANLKQALAALNADREKGDGK